MITNYSNASMLDMVFEHRNKAYGAYVLRRDANKTTRQAMLFILSAITLFCFGNYVKENIHNKAIEERKPDITVTTSDLQKKVLPPAAKIKPLVQPPKPPQTAAASATIANTDKKVVADSKATMDSIPANKDMADIDPGITTNLTGTTGIGATDGKGTDKVFEVAKEVAPATPQIFTFVEEMPKFPGGDKALMEFIARNVDYPRIERENEISGKVLTQFTVNEDGTVSDIQVLRSPSSGFNREAARVIKMLPAFKPGIQQGTPVKVRFNLPIVFKLN